MERIAGLRKGDLKKNYLKAHKITKDHEQDLREGCPAVIDSVKRKEERRGNRGVITT